MGNSFWASLDCNGWWLLFGGLLGLMGSWLVGRLFKRPSPTPVERVVDRLVDRVVPDTKGLEERDARLRALQEQHDALAASARKQETTICELDAELHRLKAPPKIELAASQAARFEMHGADDLERIEGDGPKFAELKARLAESERELERLRQRPQLDQAAARAAGFSIRMPNDLEVVEGIGPKIAALLVTAGIETFDALSKMTPAQIQPILDKAGPRFKLADPATWPEQAALAARNRWPELAALQKLLNAGRHRKGNPE